MRFKVIQAQRRKKESKVDRVVFVDQAKSYIYGGIEGMNCVMIN